ncbi:MAG: hypothetical protein CVU55_06640 [Deltaproteobacteria bacterium HGW-Deltaproteobacteria-13]|jgi:fibronectin type 3 domain-containing protein|nr:MAG: hypothetical protein CVU55_06640 [Deltaproteobacteria bacterium HGW-Deltaproteobacteria-13]
MKKILAYLLLLSLLIISVSACGSKEEAPASSTINTDIGQVQLIADAGAANVTLDWQAQAGAETYNLYYLADTGSDPDSAEIKKNGTKISGVISATHTIPNLNNGTKYWFAFSGQNSTTEGTLSKIVPATPSATPPPAAPKNVRANAGDKTVTVTWTPVTGAVKYNIYCYWQEGANAAGLGSITVTGQPSNQKIIDDANPITWIAGTVAGTTTGLTNERTYYFWVSAVNASNVEGYPSFYAYATPSTSPPPAAPVLSIIATGVDPTDGHYVDLDWTDVTGAASYKIYYSTASGIRKDVLSPVTTDPVIYTSSYLRASNLTSGVTYYFVVTAVGANGKESAESNELSATIP